MSKENIERIAEYHEREAEDEYYRNVGDDAVYDAITWNNIEPYLPRRGWILDAGGGAGVWSTKMVETGRCSVALLDIARELLKTARRRARDRALNGHIEVLQGDIRSVPLSDATVDFVLCEADPISICGDPEKATSELSRVLKPNHYFVAGVDSTLYRVFRAMSKGESLDYILDFLQKGLSPAEEGAPFDSKSFTPSEFIALLQKHGLRTVKIVGKPISLGPGMFDSFVAVLPVEKRQEIFKNKTEKKKLRKMLCRIYEEPYIAGIGSHLQIVAARRGK